MLFTAGVDVGSLAAKAAVLDADRRRVMATACLPTGPDPAEAGRRVLQAALETADIKYDGLSAVVATGYGRETVDGAQATVTEISCVARGAHLLDPATRTVIDIGGQDSKAVRLDEEGYPLDFALNDRCAAGTGRFLEVMAQALGTDVTGFERLAATATEPAQITRTCTVFAESEVVGLLARGVSAERVAAGLCRAVALRTAGLVRQIGVEPKVMLVGGVGLNRVIAAEIGRALGCELITPPQPQLVVAIGAAVIAAERMTGSRDEE